MNILSIYIGYIIDLIIGDPYSFPHPVRFIGKLIKITEDQIRKAEQFANEMISNDIKLEVLTPSKKDLKKIWIRRDLPDTTNEIRIVKIGDLDSNACCGVHPKSTLDLRLIKIKRWEKNRGNTRIEFFAGKRAIDYILKRDLILNDICKYLKSGEEEVIKGIANINDKVQEISNENKKLEAIVSDYEIKEIGRAPRQNSSHNTTSRMPSSA